MKKDLGKKVTNRNMKQKHKKIYILHGWAYSTEKWEPFLRLLKENGFDNVMLRIPGLTKPLKSVWHLDDYVSWLEKILEKESEKVILLGHSNGGKIILAYTAQNSKKVECMILLDSAGIYHNEFPLRIKRLVFGLLSKIGKKFTRSAMLRGLLYKFAREKDYEKADPLLRETMKNLISVDLRPVLSKITVPTLILWGAKDGVTPVDDGNILHQTIKDSAFYLIEGARHSPQFTHAKEVVKIILGWL